MFSVEIDDKHDYNQIFSTKTRLIIDFYLNTNLFLSPS